MLGELGFSQTQHVKGRASIADLFKPDKRCGIYILHFANGELYAGQAVDVTRRYVQHRKTHDDIDKIAFKWVPRNKLNDEERTIIWHLEQQGCSLRNVTFTSIPKGESDFDLVMSTEEQERWLNDTHYVSDSGDRLTDPDIRRKYGRHFQRFLKMPYADETLDVLRSYVRVGIPVFRRGELSFWGCSCLPSKDVYTRVNIYWQEVLTAFTFDDDLWFSLHLARSPLEEAFGRSLAPLFERHPSLEHIHHRYKPGGPDQTRVIIPGAESTKAFIADREVLPAIRLFNLRLMKKGPCAYGRYHCMDLADQLVSS